MLENNNKKAIKLITKRTLRKNRTRNTFAVLAIVLTTLMLTSVFSICFSLGRNMNIMYLRQQGSKASIFLNNPEEDQINKIKNMEDVNAAGIRIYVENVVSKDSNEETMTLVYYDKTEFEENLTPAISDIKGAYPVKADEIMLSRSAMEYLKITSPQKGMKIELDLENEKKEFQLSGWYKDYSSLRGNYPVFVSKAYIKKRGLSVDKNGILSISPKVGKSEAVLEEIEKKVTLKDGQKVESEFNIQDEGNDNMLVIAVAICLISLIIIFSGYLLIYNVMYISVTKDIRFYGMLKTIGTSPKQIKGIVKGQVFRLSFIGIPLGILLGTIISFVLTPLAMGLFGGGRDGIMPTEMTFNPVIYIGTILFAIITVLISCRKPAKIASRISPVEALKFNGITKVSPKRGMKSTQGGKTYKMAFRNVFREKKRTLIVFASLFMGTMAFLTVNTFIGSLKLDNYVDAYLPNDYTLNAYSDKKESALELADEISKIKGIQYVHVQKATDVSLEFNKDIYQTFIERDLEFIDKNELDEAIRQYENGKIPYGTTIISIGEEMVKKYNQRLSKKIDIDAFLKGNVVIAGRVSKAKEGDSLIGKNIKITDDKSGKSLEAKVASVVSDESCYGINVGHFGLKPAEPEYILVSDNFMKKLTDTWYINNIIADCDEKYEPQATMKIKGLIKGNAAIVYYIIKSEEIADFKTSMTSMNILTSGVSLILILIGILNFVNVMVTGVYTRRNELAVLESIGMTKKQVRNMLMFEGLYYAVITIGLIMTAGSGLMFLVAAMAQKIADYAVFYYPWGLMAGIAVFILCVCIIVPVCVYRIVSKESVTERLREME